MSRKRMISTLTELYAQTHQYETDTSAEWTIVNTPCRDLSPPPASCLDSATTPRLESVASSEVGAVLSIPDSNNEPVTSQVEALVLSYYYHFYSPLLSCMWPYCFLAACCHIGSLFSLN